MIARLPAVKAAEAAMDARVKAGLRQPDWLEPLRAAKRFRELD